MGSSPAISVAKVVRGAKLAGKDDDDALREPLLAREEDDNDERLEDPPSTNDFGVRLEIAEA
jgi:hypothetical protein